MVDIRTFGDGSDLQLIHGYGDGGFRVAGERHGGSLFLHTRQAQAWEPPQDLDQLTVDELMPLIGATCRRFWCWEPVRRRTIPFPILARPFVKRVSPLKFFRHLPPAGHGTSS